MPFSASWASEVFVRFRVMIPTKVDSATQYIPIDGEVERTLPEGEDLFSGSPEISLDIPGNLIASAIGDLSGVTSAWFLLKAADPWPRSSVCLK